jgi:DNA helicase-2/ATP-dependent DNA helicase PcrA
MAEDGPLLIVAGPGSGKTTVLVARIAYLVTARQLSPSAVLAITFARKPARELRARLTGVLGSRSRSVDVTTFHGFGLRVIRSWSAELGFRPGPLVVYGEMEARRVLRQVADELDVDPEEWAPGELERAVERHRLGFPADKEEQVAELAAAYEEALRERGAVDYPAMLGLPLQLFAARHDILQLYQDAYDAILCDEFQDVSGPQYAVLRSLAARHQHLTVVGDPVQTLYSWRGADVRFLLDFQQHFPEARVVWLDRNFRSTGRIVDLANRLAASLPYSRPLWTDNPPGVNGLLHVARDEHGEAAFIATEIERLLREGSLEHPGEAAILYRTNEQAEELPFALRQRHLPYRVQGNRDLFARREVQDAVAYLRLAYNPADCPALARVLDTPPRGLASLVPSLRADPVPLSELPLIARSHGPVAVAGAKALVDLIERLHTEGGSLSPAELLDRALEQSGYEQWLAQQGDGERRLEHLAALRSLLEQADGDLGSWLTDVLLGEEATADEGQGVLLATIHRAKGGEWRVVFVAGVEEGLLPHVRALSGRPDSGGALEEELRVAYLRRITRR